MKHGGTEYTETHGGVRRGPNGYRLVYAEFSTDESVPPCVSVPFVPPCFNKLR